MLLACQSVLRRVEQMLACSDLGLLGPTETKANQRVCDTKVNQAKPKANETKIKPTANHRQTRGNPKANQNQTEGKQEANQKQTNSKPKALLLGQLMDAQTR